MTNISGWIGHGGALIMFKPLNLGLMVQVNPIKRISLQEFQQDFLTFHTLKYKAQI